MIGRDAADGIDSKSILEFGEEIASMIATIAIVFETDSSVVVSSSNSLRCFVIFHSDSNIHLRRQ